MGDSKVEQIAIACGYHSMNEANPMRAELRVINGCMLFGRFETHLENCARGAGEHYHAFGRQSCFAMAGYP